MDVASSSSNGPFPAPDAAGETVAAIAQANTISADEIALYDRQIRLWGVQAQEKIRTANILLVEIHALANEVAKNLVLAGIGSITLADTGTVTEDDVQSQFLVTEADLGKNRAEAAAPEVQKLNPRVKVHTVTTDIRNEPPEFFSRFDVVIVTDLDYNSFFRLSAAARLANKPFYAAGVHEFYGFIFADLIKHHYVLEREKGNRPTLPVAESATRRIVESKTKKENGKTIELVTKEELYTPLNLANTSPLPPQMLRDRRKLRRVTPLLSCLRALWEYQQKHGDVFPDDTPEDIAEFTRIAMEKHQELQLPLETLTAEFQRKFLTGLGLELPPVPAFLGGQLAQDVINVLGQREQPIQNMLLFDGEDMQGNIYPLHPVFADPAPVTVPTAAAQNVEVLDDQETQDTVRLGSLAADEPGEDTDDWPTPTESELAEFERMEGIQYAVEHDPGMAAADD